MARNQSYPREFRIDDFSLGWCNTNKPTTLDSRTVVDIKNFNLTKRKGIEKRGGISELYSSTAGADTDITSLFQYIAPDGYKYILTATGTVVRAYYNAKWNDLKTGLTTGKKYSFQTHRGLCFGANGIDDNFKLRNTTSYGVGIVPPLGKPSVEATKPSGATLKANHSTDNIDHIGELRQATARSVLAQSFKLDRDYDLSKIVLKCRKLGSPVGNMSVEIHSDRVGTLVTNGTSGAVAVAGFDTTLTATNFTFSTAPSLSAGFTYYIVIKSANTVSTSAYVEVGFDWNNGYGNGLYYEIDGDTLSTATWASFDSADLGFEVWGTQVGAELLLEYGALDTGDYAELRRQKPYAGRMYENGLLSQEFKLSAGRDISSVKLALQRRGSPGGNVWVEIHDSKVGTSSTKNASDNMVTYGSSANVAVSSISADPEWVTFSFGATKPSLGTGTYYLVLYCSYEESFQEYVSWTINADTYGDGELWAIHDVTFAWTAFDEPLDDDSKDASFKFYGINTTAEAAESHNDITQVRGLWETNSQQMIAQSFPVDETGTLPRVNVYMAKTGTPTTNIWAEIHSEPTGTSASKNSSDFIVGTASDNVIIASTEKAYFTAGETEISISDILTGNSSGKTATVTQVILESGAWADDNAAGYMYSTNANGAFTAGEDIKVSGAKVAEITADWAILIESFSTAGIDSFNWVTFNFNGTVPSLTKGNKYYIVIYGDMSAASTSNFINIASDKAPAGYDGGIKHEINTSEAWANINGQDLIFETWMVTTGLTATYRYCYTYKRTGWLPLESNPSDVSDAVAPSGQDVNIGVVASADAQVDKIFLWRTLADETTPFYMVNADGYANETATITEGVSDNRTMILWDETNTLPPKATFIKLHQDRMFYANCPDEDEGGSLVMWSKSGNGEVVPSVNYQYFDKDDGEEITGVASLGVSFIVFKPSKVGLLFGELADPASMSLSYLSQNIGCIAPWAILTLQDKIIFLSEAGWKATNGVDIWDLSDNINGLIESGYLSIDEKENYSIAFYPEKEQVQFLMNHSTLSPKVIAGQFLIPLTQRFTGASELIKQNLMGWTYHEYDYHELTCLGTYSDSNGITKVIAGASNGYVYELDSGTDDDGEVITTKLQTDWLSLGISRSLTKTIRKGYLAYETSGTISLNLTIDKDFGATTDDPYNFTGSDVDIDDSTSESFNMSDLGELFRFTFIETSKQGLSLMGLTVLYRSEGAR